MRNSVTRPAADSKATDAGQDGASLAKPGRAQPQMAAAMPNVPRSGSRKSVRPASATPSGPKPLSPEAEMSVPAAAGRSGSKAAKTLKAEVDIALPEPVAAASPPLKSKLEKILPHTLSLSADADIPAAAEPVVVAAPVGFAAPHQEVAPMAPDPIVAMATIATMESEPAESEPAAPPTPERAPEPERRINVNDRNPPRIPSKAENFVAGDHVVYPTHGVGKVEKIAVEEIAGHSLELIHITFEENRMTLRVPVSKARSAGLRKLASRKMFDEALAVLKGRARIKRTMWSRRAQEYEAKINSGDPLSIAEVVRDLHRNAGQPDQSFSERQIYEAAMDRLAAELGALDSTDKVTAVAKLAGFLKTVA